MLYNTTAGPKVEQSGDVRILTFTTGAFRAVPNVLAGELEGQTGGILGGHLLLDFTNVTRISSEELGTLVGLHKRLHAAGSRLTLFNLTPDIYEVFSVTRLDSLIAICREAHVPLAPRSGTAAGRQATGNV